MNNIVKEDEKQNKIIGCNPNLINSTIKFIGENNVLYCEENVVLNNSDLMFGGSNSIIYLSTNSHKYNLNVEIYNNSVLFIDENNYMNDLRGRVNLMISEQTNILIGKDGTFSFDIWAWTGDPHLIYDCETKERTNLSKSIFIGDHVWIGQDTLILKGSKVGSGSIVGAKSVVTNKRINSNTIWAGNPAKLVKENSFFVGKSVHRYTNKETEESMKFDSDEYIYKSEGKIYDFNDIDKELSNIELAEEKIKYLQNIREEKSKNRFFI